MGNYRYLKHLFSTVNEVVNTLKLLCHLSTVLLISLHELLWVNDFAKIKIWARWVFDCNVNFNDHCLNLSWKSYGRYFNLQFGVSDEIIVAEAICSEQSWIKDILLDPRV